MRVSSITRDDAERELKIERRSKYRDLYNQILALDKNGCTRVESEDKADGIRIAQSIRQWLHRNKLSDKVTVYNRRGTIYVMLRCLLLALLLTVPSACVSSASTGTSVGRPHPRYICVGEYCREKAHRHTRHCGHKY